MAGRAIQRIDRLVKETNWKQIPSDAVEAVKNNPRAVVIPAAVVAGAATGGVLMGPVLGAIGFSSIGPVAGSMAAGIQSAGAAGALFGTLQSAAMGGYGVAATLLSFAGVGAATGGAVGAAARAATKGSSNTGDDKIGAVNDGRTDNDIPPPEAEDESSEDSAESKKGL